MVLTFQTQLRIPLANDFLEERKKSLPMEKDENSRDNLMRLGKQWYYELTLPDCFTTKNGKSEQKVVHLCTTTDPFRQNGLKVQQKDGRKFALLKIDHEISYSKWQ